MSSVGRDRISAKAFSYVLLRKDLVRAKQQDPKAYTFLATIPSLTPSAPWSKLLQMRRAAHVQMIPWQWACKNRYRLSLDYLPCFLGEVCSPCHS